MLPRIILASKSSGRKAIFEKLGLPFEVIVSDFVEDMTLPLSADKLALHLSQGKANVLAEKHSDAVIIAADTFVVFEEKFLGKPRDEEHAKEMLSKLSGNTHVILTGLTVRQGNKSVSEVVFTNVSMKKLSPEEIDWYVNSGEPMGKAGSYAIQGNGSRLIESIDGDYFNIIGLPLKSLVGILNKDFLIPVNLPKNL